MIEIDFLDLNPTVRAKDLKAGDVFHYPEQTRVFMRIKEGGDSPSVLLETPNNIAIVELCNGKVFPILTSAVVIVVKAKCQLSKI